MCLQMKFIKQLNNKIQDNINMKINTTSLINEKKSTNDFIDINMSYNQVYLSNPCKGLDQN
jgi:hypothetical protein